MDEDTGTTTDAQDDAQDEPQPADGVSRMLALLADMARKEPDGRLAGQLELIRVRAQRAGIMLDQAPVQLSRARRQIVLAGVAAGFSVSRAADLAGVTPSSVYQAKARDPEGFGAELEAAREIGVDEIEDRLRDIALRGPIDSMASVTAGRIVLEGNAQRYKRGQAARQPAKVETTFSQGPDGRPQISVSVGQPGPD